MEKLVVTFSGPTRSTRSINSPNVNSYSIRHNQLETKKRISLSNTLSLSHLLANRKEPLRVFFILQNHRCLLICKNSGKLKTDVIIGPQKETLTLYVVDRHNFTNLHETALGGVHTRQAGSARGYS